MNAVPGNKKGTFINAQMNSNNDDIQDIKLPDSPKKLKKSSGK
jgi:hypothetical protein